MITENVLNINERKMKKYLKNINFSFATLELTTLRAVLCNKIILLVLNDKTLRLRDGFLITIHKNYIFKLFRLFSRISLTLG